MAGTGIVMAATAFFGERELLPMAPPAELDPTITAQIRVGQFPVAVAAGEGAMWVTVNDTEPAERWFLARIDPSTNAVSAEIEFFEAAEVAVGAGAVWISGRDRGEGQALVRIEPETGQVVTRIPLGCSRCHVDQIVARPEAVWMTVASLDDISTGEVVRVDPATDQIAARIPVEGDPRDLTVGEGGVWVYALTHFDGGAVSGGTIYRIDPFTNQVAAELLRGQVPPVAGISTPPVLTAGHGHLWTSRLTDQGSEVVRIDPETYEVLPLEVLTGATFGYYPFSAEGGGIWFRGGYEDARPVIARLDPTTGSVGHVLQLDSTAIDAALDPETMTIWVADYERWVTRIDLPPSWQSGS